MNSVIDNQRDMEIMKRPEMQSHCISCNNIFVFNDSKQTDTVFDIDSKEHGKIINNEKTT